MLLFRAEENVASWCATHGIPMCPRIRLDQLWHLAVQWYANRLTKDSRRPGPDEMAGIFAGIRLEGPFWDPHADPFGAAT
jgi:hypothetical protein